VLGGFLVNFSEKKAATDYDYGADISYAYDMDNEASSDRVKGVGRLKG